MAPKTGFYYIVIDRAYKRYYVHTWWGFINQVYKFVLNRRKYKQL